MTPCSNIPPASEPPQAEPAKPQAGGSLLDLTLSVPGIAGKALQSLCEIREKVKRGELEGLLGPSGPRLLFIDGTDKVIDLAAETAGVLANWFFLGDIHGDFFALYSAVEHIRILNPEFRLVFLGDLVDRGPHPIECLAYFLMLAAERPDCVIWLTGNHDTGVYIDAADIFRSLVSPSEFVDELNLADGQQSQRHRIGKGFIDLIARLPRAVLFPDGLLATHGGFPLSDLQESLFAGATSEEIHARLNLPECLEDFTWTRITRFPSKIPNRLSKGCSYGFRNFATFCAKTEAFWSVKRLVTGHEHPEAGFDRHETWIDAGALTLVGFGFDSSYDPSIDNKERFIERYRPSIFVGKYRENQLPEVVQIGVDGNALGRYVEAEAKIYGRNAI